MRKNLKLTKITCLLLCTFLLFTTIPFTSVALDINETAITEGSVPNQSVDTSPTLEEPSVIDTQPMEFVSGLGRGEKTYAELQKMSVDLASLPTFINAEVALEKKHVHRVKEQEENLRTVIYQNQDGSKSTYLFAQPVKYVDENGTVKDRSTKISAINSGVYAYGMTDNLTKAYFPSSSQSGTKITFNDYAITVTPMTATSATPVYVEGDVVRYDGVFGTNTSVVYQTKLNGIKEDIVLIRNIGKNEFQFELTLQNLVPFEQDGVWYVKNAENETVATFGEIAIRDTAGNTALGTMQITAGTARGQYTVTITAPEAFLNASSTVYPVFVDPSVTYYIWEEGEYDDGYGGYVDYDAITDTGLYSTAAVAEYAAEYPQTHMLGYISEDFGTATGKIIYKLYDFFGTYGKYKTLRASQIGTAYLYIDAWSSDGETTVTVHPMTSTWLADVVGENPTALYNSTLWSAYDSTYGSTSTMDEANAFQSIDITSIVKSWARFNTGEEGAAYNPAYGLLLSSNDPDYYREIYSSEATYDNNMYVLMDTGIIGGIYCIDNAMSREFLKPNGYEPTILPYDHANNFKWHIEYIGNGKYYIHSTSNQPTTLCAMGNTLLLVSLPEQPTDLYKWELITGNGIKLKNVYSGKVLRYDGTSLVMSDELSSTSVNYQQTIWGFNYILPLSGAEIAYNRALWEDFCLTNNCYNYALNMRNTVSGGIYDCMQPGRAVGDSSAYLIPQGTYLGYPYYYQQLKTPGEIESNAIADANFFGITFTPIDKYNVCPVGTYKIALVVDYTDDANVVNELRLWRNSTTGEVFWLERPDTDYHWYRQNADGTWSHKPGQTAVTAVDDSNNLIFDPATCDRNYEKIENEERKGVYYSVFVGYYAVSPLG